MVREDILEGFDGSFGVTQDEEFEQIVDYLAEYGTVVGEDEIGHQGFPSKSFAELVVTKYSIGSQLYELWYQVRTPYSPQDMACAYGFNSLEVAVK
jgi:hypothetical protein